MLKLTDIHFDDTMILNQGKFILVELVPTYQTETTPETGNHRIGTTAVVALTGHRLEKIEVFLEAIIPCSPFSELELAEVTFSGFEGHFDWASGEALFKATAKQLHLISH
ncbi:hypothetical protein I6N95_04335 [Vagococcus sp. BWB3-3]|uniref:Uncharacterized protein n=1 Tax=Vagococcus allomyrinae TaxID=2794353 RepID=A0A940PB70_9ENTE|nr:hypothetical protein [Vagococcus allomyrinae]MBP1040236.1 hypothetical protein [Vagococcus allomyrinae]